MNVVRVDGSDVHEAYKAILLGEKGTAPCMLSGAEFEQALGTRDCYAFKRGFYLLITLEISWKMKDSLGFSGSFISTELIMRKNAQ